MFDGYLEKHRDGKLSLAGRLTGLLSILPVGSHGRMGRADCEGSAWQSDTTKCWKA